MLSVVCLSLYLTITLQPPRTDSLKSLIIFVSSALSNDTGLFNFSSIGVRFFNFAKEFKYVSIFLHSLNNSTPKFVKVFPSSTFSTIFLSG